LLALGVLSVSATWVAGGIDAFRTPSTVSAAVSEREAPWTWKLYGPDANGVYGGLQGLGGLELLIPANATTNSTGVLLNRFGDVVAGIGGTNEWAGTRTYSYGPDPSTVSATLMPGVPLWQALAWRGKWRDPSRLYWMGARMYDAESGTFLSCDPMGFAGQYNLYAFCNGDAVNLWDGDGRQADIASGLFPATMSHFTSQHIGGSSEAQLHYANEVNSIRAFIAAVGTASAGTLYGASAVAVIGPGVGVAGLHNAAVWTAYTPLGQATAASTLIGGVTALDTGDAQRGLAAGAMAFAFSYQPGMLSPRVRYDAGVPSTGFRWAAGTGRGGQVASLADGWVNTSAADRVSARFALGGQSIATAMHQAGAAIEANQGTAIGLAAAFGLAAGSLDAWPDLNGLQGWDLPYVNNLFNVADTAASIGSKVSTFVGGATTDPLGKNFQK
jgi:RHS repeat-associated protein